jgi:hypothetical protein
LLMVWASSLGCKPYKSSCVSGCIDIYWFTRFVTLFLICRYREQIDKVNRLKEDTVRAIVKSSTELGLFKEEVSRHLKELRDFVEAG